MSDIYGGPGSAFGGGLDLQSGAVGYNGDNSGALNSPLDIAPQVAAPAPDALPQPQPQSNAPATPQPSQPQSNGPTFGGALSPWPNYTPPDPKETALDQSATLLQQRIQRAGQIASNPLAQFFAPEQVAAARDAVPKMTEQLQTIQAQKAQVQAGRNQAQQLGLTPDEAPDQATQDDRLQVASTKALNGDLKAFQGIAAIAPDRAAAIAPQVYAKIGAHLDNAQNAFDSLSGMENEGQYQAKIRQLRQDGTLTDLEGAGLKLPPTLDAFKAAAPNEALALRNARIAVNAQGQQLEARNTYQPMETKEQDTYKGALKTVYGDELNLGPWSRNGATGTRGQLANGIATVDDYGKTGGAATADQRTQLGKDFEAAVPPTDIEKLRGFNRTYSLAVTDDKGNPLPANQINTNPNVSQAVSESLAALLRGGRGSATAGLLNIESSKRGAVQSMFDKIQGAYAGTINTLSADEVRPYLTKLTQEQQRAVLDGLNNYTNSNVTDRALGVARRAGALGLGVDALGLGKDEAGPAINNAVEQGRQAQVERMRPYFQPIGAGNGVLQLGAQRPGANPASLPPGASPTNQLPNAQPLLTPVQQAGQTPPVAPPATGTLQQPTTPAPPATQPSSPSGGGAGTQPPQPITVAGQQISPAMPPGASATYPQTVQRIETGKSKNPWTTSAGGGLSSAGGAFQFTDGTWLANRPAGAPDHAKDATPEQQSAALASFTQKSATALQTVGLPVSDTNLYVTHNLGAGGGTKLLQADPNADARTIVGEAAARNNPQFFKGRPTVAIALQRYADAVNGGPAPSSLPGTAADIASRVAGAVPIVGVAKTVWDHLTPSQQDAAKKFATDNAPAIGSTAGAIVGGSVGNVPGAIAGGAVGGGAGQALKDYVQGNPQSPTDIAKQTALGGVLGVASEARPIAAVAARVAGAAGVEAGSTAAQGGSGADMVDAAMRGTGEAAGGEAFGRALGMVGHKVFSLFAPDAKAAVQSAAKTYADSSKVLETEPPKLPGVGGAASGPNPKFDAAQAAKDKAETTLKDAGLDPEEAAYAHSVSSQGVPTQEAQVSKPGELEKQNIGQGYQQLSSEVAAKGVGAVKPTPKLTDGPLVAAQTAKMAPELQGAAQRAEMAATAPAANWQEKWQQLQDARSSLLQGERDALSSTATGKTQTAQDYRTLADSIRTQQSKAANYVFGAQQGPQVMQRLNALDVRYRRLMDATNGGDLVQAANLKGAAGRDADQKFKAFAAGDPTAVAAWNAMRGNATGPNYEKGIYNIMAAERLPIAGTVVSGVRLLGTFNRWMQERAAGSPARFADILKGMPEGGSRAARDVVGTVAQRGAVQGDVLNGATP